MSPSDCHKVIADQIMRWFQLRLVHTSYDSLTTQLELMLLDRNSRGSFLKAHDVVVGREVMTHDTRFEVVLREMVDRLMTSVCEDLQLVLDAKKIK